MPLRWRMPRGERSTRKSLLSKRRRTTMNRCPHVSLRATAMSNQNLWSGERLPQGMLAMILLEDSADPAVDPSVAVVAVAASGAARHIEIGRQRVGQFLIDHADRELVCYDSARVHWALHGYLQANAGPRAMSSLWGFSRRCRLHDVMLLDQRLGLIETGQHVTPRPLAELAHQRSRITLSNPCGAEEQLRAVLAVYDVLRQEAEGVLPRLLGGGSEEGANASAEMADRDDGYDAERFRSDPYYASAVRRRVNAQRLEVLQRRARQFGPLALGIDVQGAIALEEARRTGLGILRDAIEPLRLEAETLYQENCRVLHHNQQARAVFRWENGSIARSKGHPRSSDRHRLGQWLCELLSTCAKEPRRLPLDQHGQFLAVPEAWDVPVNAHPLLAAWNKVYAASGILRFLDQVEADGNEITRPRYNVFPRIRSTEPNLLHFGHCRQAIIAPPSGYEFLLITLRDLEFRCFTAKDFDWSGVRSEAFWAFLDGNDSAKEELDKNQTQWLVGQCPHLRSDEDRLAAIRLLFFALPRGLSNAAIAELFRVKMGMVEMSEEDVRKMLVEPDSAFLAAWEGRCLHLSAGQEELACRHPAPKRTPIAARDEETVAHPVGGTSLWPNQMHGVPSWRMTVPGKCTLQYRMMRDSIRPSFQEMQQVNSISITGRVGRPVLENEACTAAYLGLADEVRKTIAYELVAAGYNLAAVAGDEFVVTIPEGSPAQLDEQITLIANAAAMKLLDVLARDCWTSQRTKTWIPSRLNF